MYCTFCGRELECELEYAGTKQYHCHECDTLFTLRDGTIDYLCNAMEILLQLAEDLDMNGYEL